MSNMSTLSRWQRNCIPPIAPFFVLVIGVMAMTACVDGGEENELPDYDSIEILPEVVFREGDDQPLDF